MLECRLLINKKKFICHFDQAINGFQLLHKQKAIKLKMDFSNCIDIPFNNCFCCIADGKKIFYDLSDGTTNFEVSRCRDFLQSHNAVMFKRAYEDLLYDNEELIFPYGLNYLGLYPFHWRLYRRVKRIFTRVEPPLTFPTPEEQWAMRKTCKTHSNDILFCTRFVTNHEELNENRILLTYKLRKIFKNNIVAGIADSPLARKLCKDLILPEKITRRSNFIELVNRSKICIASTGMHRSIGWRFGEFVAAGKAIVSEKLFFSVPGDFREGENYLAFNTHDEAVGQCSRLLDDHAGRRDMEIKNLAYYFNYLKPDVLIMNTLKQALASK